MDVQHANRYVNIFWYTQATRMCVFRVPHRCNGVCVVLAGRKRCSITRIILQINPASRRQRTNVPHQPMQRARACRPVFRSLHACNIIAYLISARWQSFHLNGCHTKIHFRTYPACAKVCTCTLLRVHLHHHCNTLSLSYCQVSGKTWLLDAERSHKSMSAHAVTDYWMHKIIMHPPPRY